MLNITDTTLPGVDQPQSPGTTQRTLAFGGVTAVIAGLVAAPSIEFPTHASSNANVDTIDLALIQLCDSIVAVREEETRLQEVMYDLIPDTPDHDPTFDRIVVLGGRASVLAEQIGRLPPACTIAGIQARAAAVQAMMPVDHGDEQNVPINWHRGMLDALLRDVMGRA